MKPIASACAVLFLLLSGGTARSACDVATTNVNFGAYDVFVPMPLDSTGTVSVSCDEAPPPDVVISVGPSANTGGYHPRKMRRTSGSSLLEYNLFTDATMTAVWGDGTAGTSTVHLRKIRKNRPPEVVTIYGRIPPGQDASVGSYGDTLTVTILW